MEEEGEYAVLSNNLKIHYYEFGSSNKIPIILLHGFPELSYAWRRQVEPLENSGFRVIVPDQRGYGRTDSPYEIEQYGLQYLTEDLIYLLDHLKIEKAIFCGHDWGGAVIWGVGLHYPERVLGLIGICTPFLPANPKINPIQSMENFSNWDYQLYIIENQNADSVSIFSFFFKIEIELEENIEKTLKVFLTDNVDFGGSNPWGPYNCRKNGGMLKGIPNDIQLSSILNEKEFQIYLKAFQKTGFRGGLNWYRNMENNWKFNLKKKIQKIENIPSLMITAKKDIFLPPILSQKMNGFVTDLSSKNKFLDSVMQEKPEELNQILIEWINSKFNPIPKL